MCSEKGPADLPLRQHNGENKNMQLFFYTLNYGRSPSGELYSETTWAVGIAQLTHHEVQGGGKNPETGGRGIFAPTANRVVS